MFFYQKNRFYTDGLSFQLPEEFYLDTSSEEKSMDGITLYPKEETFELELMVVHDSMDAILELKRLFSEIPKFSLKEPITPFLQNGLSGGQVTYHCAGTLYYEMRFNVQGRYEFSNFVLLITSNQSIQKAKSHPGVLSLIQSIRREA